MDDLQRLAIYKEAVDILESWGHASSLRSDYSGRFMYGKEVPAIVTDASGPEVGQAVSEACEFLDVEDARGAIPRRSDNMGLSMVYY